MKITIKQIKEAESRLKPCPFCGKSVEICICDYEGNPKDAEYLKDPRTGLAFVITHNVNDACLMYCDKDENLCIGQFRFTRLMDLVNTWNHRPQANRIERVLDEMESWADGEEKNNHYDCRNLGTDAVRGWATVMRDYLTGGTMTSSRSAARETSPYSSSSSTLTESARRTSASFRRTCAFVRCRG